MATTKIEPIRTSRLQSILYGINYQKTLDGLLVSSFACSVRTADIEMKMTAKQGSGIGNRIGYVLYQNFSPEDNITPEQAHELGKQYADRVLKGKFEYVIATHTDKAHLHNHIIFNSVSFFGKHEKFRFPKGGFYRLKEINDDICRANNLSVIEQTSGIRGRGRYEYMQSKAGTSWKDALRADIDETIASVKSFDEFVQVMTQEKGYLVKRKGADNQEISFKASGQDRFCGLKVNTLGKAYTQEAITSRIENPESAEKYKTIINPNNSKDAGSGEGRLKNAINEVVPRAKDYDDFVRIMVSEKGYQYTQRGKYDGFIESGGKKTHRLRASTLGEEYSKERIIDRIEHSKNPQERENQRLQNTQTAEKRITAKQGVDKPAFKPDPKRINLIVDISKNLKAQQSQNYEQALIRSNINTLVKTMNFLISHDLKTADRFENYYSARLSEYELMHTLIKNDDNKLCRLSEKIKQLQNYKKYHNLYAAAMRAGSTSKFYKEHTDELVLYESSNLYFEHTGENPDMLNLADLFNQFKQIRQNKTSTEDKFKGIKKQIKELDTVRKNVEATLGIKLLNEEKAMQEKSKNNKNQDIQY